MKSYICILFTIVILSTTLDCRSLKSKDPESLTVINNEKPQTEVDPKTVKSPGDFSNLAPETSQIITPKYACKLYFKYKPLNFKLL